MALVSNSTGEWCEAPHSQRVSENSLHHKACCCQRRPGNHGSQNAWKTEIDDNLPQNRIDSGRRDQRLDNLFGTKKYRACADTQQSNQKYRNTKQTKEHEISAER